MPNRNNASRLTDPRFCIREAARLVIPVTEDNWDQVKDDADELNTLQAAITHLVYMDTRRTEFQEQVMKMVFTAYLMGRTADRRLQQPDWDAFQELIAGLDLSGLPAAGDTP